MGTRIVPCPHTWEYDNAGNILNRKEYTYTTNELDTPLKTVVYTYGDSAWGDLLTAYDGQAITYDTIGNPLNDGTWTYTWEHGRQLAAMTDGQTQWSFTYNAAGLRTSKTNGADTYTYVYNGGLLSQMTKGTDTLRFAYDASGLPMTVTYNGTVYYYVTNIQGDVIAILDTAGDDVVQYVYNAWGNPAPATGTMANTLGALNPLRYRSYVYDQETGLYYVSSRYYDPEIGRWINVDGLVSTDQGLLSNNMFVYCLNNPVNYVDYNGELPLKVSRYLLTKWVLGKGKRLKLNKNSCVSRALKKSKTMKAKILEEIEKYEKGKFTGTGTVKFTNKEPDLWLGVRQAHYEVSIKKETKTTGFWRCKKTKTRYVVSVKVWDNYDFNSGDEKGDGLGSLLNNLGYYAQQKKIGTEYYWEANYVYKTKWK